MYQDVRVVLAVVVDQLCRPPTKRNDDKRTGNVSNPLAQCPTKLHRNRTALMVVSSPKMRCEQSETFVCNKIELKIEKINFSVDSLGFQGFH